MKGLLLGLGALFIMLVVIPTASAKVDGPCTAMIAGADLMLTDKVTVQAGDTVDYVFAADQPVVAYELQLLYGPYAATPSQGTSESGDKQISGTANLGDYAWLGVGLYEVKGNVELADGSMCAGSILVEVEGNPLTTAVGATAAAISGASTIGLILLFLKDAGVLFS